MAVTGHSDQQHQQHRLAITTTEEMHHEALVHSYSHGAVMAPDMLLWLSHVYWPADVTMVCMVSM